MHYLKSNDYNVFEYTNLTFTHAESPAWDPASDTLYWVDVLNQDVHSLHYYTKKHKVKHISKYYNYFQEANSWFFLLFTNATRVHRDWLRTPIRAEISQAIPINAREYEYDPDMIPEYEYDPDKLY